MSEVILALIIVAIYYRVWKAGLWDYHLIVDLLIFQALVNVLAPLSHTVYDHWAVASVLCSFVLPWAIAIAYFERRHRKVTSPT